MKKSTCLFVSFIFSMTIYAQENNIGSNRKLTTVQMKYYSFDYPGTWLIDTSHALGIDVFVKSPKEDSLDKFSENVNVFLQDLTGQGYDLLRMGRESEAQVQNLVNDFEILESRLDTISVIPYYSLKFKGRQGKFLLITSQRYYLKGNTGFAVTFTMEAANEERYRVLSKEIMDFFRFR
ncbi:MAG: hypothetical protein QM781_00220 [Chitinophagaceae bacterium]